LSGASIEHGRNGGKTPGLGSDGGFFGKFVNLLDNRPSITESPAESTVAAGVYVVHPHESTPEADFGVGLRAYPKTS
jgi:hypothetical protein